MSTGRESNAPKLFHQAKNAVNDGKEIYALDFSKNSKKNFISYPANNYEDSLKQQVTTCPAYLIQEFSNYLTISSLPSYARAFFSDDEKYRYRDGVILERDGEWFPQVAEATPEPGQPLTSPKAFYPAPYSEKHGEETFWLKVLIDYQSFDYAERYYEAEHYFNFLRTIWTKDSNATSRFILQYIHAWIYGATSKAVWFEKSSDDQIMWASNDKSIAPEESFSKLAHKYYKNDGEIKKELKKIAGWAELKHKNRVLYDPIHLSKALGFATPEISEDEYSQEFTLPDLSSSEKIKTYIKDTYFSKTDQGKFIPSTMNRGASLIALTSTILETVQTFSDPSPLQTNTFAYDLKESAKDDNAAKKADVQKTRCDAANLIVLMNRSDKANAGALNASELTPVVSNYGVTPASMLAQVQAMGAQVYGCPILLPGWAIVCDKRAFHIYRYFHGAFEEKHWYHLIKQHIGHSMFRPVMFGQVSGAVILPVTKNSFTAPQRFYDKAKTFGFLK